MLKSGKLLVIGYPKSLKASLVAVQSIMTEHCCPSSAGRILASANMSPIVAMTPTSKLTGEPPERLEEMYLTWSHHWKSC